MVEFLECVMLFCFGVSWPISVYKSFTSKSSGGKSVLFYIAILVGYAAGIGGKIIGGNINYTLILYFFNVTFVSLDLILYFVNKRRENASCTPIHANGMVSNI